MQVRKETSVTLTSKQRRSSAVAFGGRRPQRFSKCKRDRRHGRSSKRHGSNCSLIQGRYRENDRLPNMTELGDSRFAKTTVPHNDGTEAVRGNSGEVTNVCEKFESPCGRYARGQEMQTISEEDLVFSDEGDNAIDNPAPEEINGHEVNLRISEHEANFRSRTPSPTRGVGDKVRSYSPVRCAEHKCSRCFNSGAQSVPTDNSNPTRSERIHRLYPSCTQTLSRLYNCKVSLDAFRCHEKSCQSCSSIFWKIASVIYVISGLINDGLTKLMSQDEGEEEFCCGMDNKREGIASMRLCRPGWKDRRNVGTVIEQTSSLDCIQRTVECSKPTRKGPMPESREDDAMDRTTSKSSMTRDYNVKKCAYRASCGAKFPKQFSTRNNGLIGSTAKIRKSTFRPKTTNSRVPITQSGSSPVGISDDATEDSTRVDKEARISSIQCSASRVIVSPKESNIEPEPNKGNVALMDIDTKVCESNACQSYDEIEACNHYITDVEDISADELREDVDDSEDVSSSVTTVVPTQYVYGVRDSEEPSDTSKFRGVHSEESCSQVYRDFNNVSEADSSDSFDCQRARKPKRSIKRSTKARKDRSRLSCRDNPLARYPSVIQRVSGTDCRIERPYETVIQSRLEYFKDVTLEDARGELATLELPCSKIPRLVRHGGEIGREAGLSDVSSCRHCALESYGAGGELQRWDQKSIEKKTALATRRRNGAQVTSRSPRSFKSTRNRVCMCNY